MEIWGWSLETFGWGWEALGYQLQIWKHLVIEWGLGRAGFREKKYLSKVGLECSL